MLFAERNLMQATFFAVRKETSLARLSLVLRLQAKYSSLKQYAIPSLILGNAEILFFENPIGAFFLNGHALNCL